MADGFVYGGAGLATIDAKGRVTIPAELRTTIEASSGGSHVCLSRHPELPCLIAFGRTERQQIKRDIDFRWEKAVERGEPFDREEEGARIAPYLSEIGFEANGRFVLPPMLQHFGKLDGRAFFFGNLYQIQIWNPDLLAGQSGAKLGSARDALDYCLATAGKRVR